MRNNLKKKILNELKESGFPIEIEAVRILENMGWKVSNQVGYLDIDENKWRRVDIRGVRAENTEQSLGYKRLVLHLYIECKRSDNPWVFYAREKEKMPFHPFEILSILKEVSWPPVLPKSFLDEKQWQMIFHFLKLKDIGIISFEPFAQKGKDKIFEASNQVVKSLKYSLERSKTNLSIVKHSVFCWAYPIILTDARLFAFYGKNRPLVEVKYLPYLFNYKEEDFLIDIVHLNYFNKYLQLIGEEFEALKKNINLLQSHRLNKDYL